MNMKQLAKLHSLIEQHEINPRFIGRRSIDKSCGEVVEVIDPDVVSEDSHRVVERIDKPNFAGEEAATVIARVKSRSWLVQEMEKVFVEAHYPTEDAYMSACRALHWRTAELRFHGVEPIQIPQDASHYPPDGFDFGKRSKEKVCAHCGVALPQHGTTCPVKVQKY